MKIADMLNPVTVNRQLASPPLSPPEEDDMYYSTKRNNSISNHGKPRSRFSDIEDAIICEGVARGLTWGQISGQLPHRKRATCFNRYRTLQGIRKSRKRSLPDMRSPPITPPHSNAWLPSSPNYHRKQSLPVLVAPLPTRLPLPLYSDRIH
ncbi:uncharacterized protein B0P05DRAFT_571529 [Gilbertella persicaria]|uniref:Myb-like domain-containing protein n=1 Tax=Rhizopus stolonifer TaxID=4846 RepID=A0A367KT11_RHIST|nr:uncharacterized protein B0P05DRAFT_571529 [Gilbertella persicaria]KAI8079611.1 hypothetical protein B0P05DRAFT_571529 [Gilbertella persicaria]RCI05335.1 hypothetical protein CU098_007376 [Rhizopus stolonifer]